MKQLLKLIYIISFLFSYPIEYVLLKLPVDKNELVKKYYNNGITYEVWYGFMQEYREKNPVNFTLLLYLPTITTLFVIISIIGFAMR